MLKNWKQTYEKTFVFLLHKYPYYAFVLAQMPKISSQEIPIAGIVYKNKRFNLLINPYNFGNFTLKERLAILIHEILHILHLHPLRAQNLDNRQKQAFNLAADLAINQLIDNLPEESINISSLSLHFQYDFTPLESTEYYYEVIKDLFKKTSPNTLPNLHTHWNQWEIESKAVLKNDIQRIIKTAYEDAVGNIPGEIEEWIEPYLDSQINWKQKLTLFSTKYLRKNRKSTLKKINKRFAHLPGKTAHRQRQLIVAIDTSGSITTNNLQKFTSELRKIQKHAEVIVLEFDAKVQKEYKLTKNIKTNFLGRGGTDFRVIWEYLKKKNIKGDGLLILTDGKGPTPINTFIPTMWVLTKGAQKPVEWGYSINI